MILASCSLDEARKHNNNLVVVSDGSTKKPEKVFLNVETDSPEDAFKLEKGVVKCITTTIKPSFCPTAWAGNVFYKVDSSSIEDISGVPEGVVPLVVYPQGYDDMRTIYDLCSSNPSVRVTGGNILEISGVRIGRYDEGKEKMSAVFNGCYDMFKEVSLSDIKVTEIMPKVRKTAGVSAKKRVSTGSKSTKSPSTKAKKVASFGKLFSESGDCEF